MFQGNVLRLGLRYIVSSVVDSCSFQGMVQHLWISWRLHHWIVLPVRMTPWHDMSCQCHVLSYYDFDFQIGWWWTHDSLATSHQISMVQWRRCHPVVSVQDFSYASFNGVIIGNFWNCLVSDTVTFMSELDMTTIHFQDSFHQRILIQRMGSFPMLPEDSFRAEQRVASNGSLWKWCKEIYRWRRWR